MSESDSDPLNSTINPRGDIRIFIPSERAESNPNLLGFIDESLYTGQGTGLMIPPIRDKARVCNCNGRELK